MDQIPRLGGAIQGFRVGYCYGQGSALGRFFLAALSGARGWNEAGGKKVTWEVTGEQRIVGLRKKGAHKQGYDVWEEGEGRPEDVQCC